MESPRKFARWIFLVAGCYGLIVVAPQYFLESRISADNPPPIAHPEYFYGFIGVALAWQVAFLVIARDVIRFRPMMLPAVLEKLTFGLATIVLYLRGRLAIQILAFGLIDLVLAALFIYAFVATGRESMLSE